MKVYNPQISVLLFKSFPRSEVIPGIPANQARYNRADGIELYPFLGDGGSVHTSKNIRQPMGSWVVRFGDQRDHTLLDSVSALVEPGDLVEIYMSHGPAKGGKLPLIMRGFVSEIIRDESMGDNGKPSRFVEVRGADLSKALTSFRINYKFGTTNSPYQTQEMRFFYAFAGQGSIKNNVRQ